MTVERHEMTKRFERLGVQLCGFKSVARLNYRCSQVFQGARLQDADLLEIGAGSGCFSGYAATQGARSIVALEPQAAGSGSGAIQKLAQMRADIGHPRFDVSLDPIEQFDPGDKRFDVVLMYNVVNHLDESLCRVLRISKPAHAAYEAAFTRISKMMRLGAQLILADCSRYNAFALLGLNNPLMPSIDWSIHQPARVWKQILRPLGFQIREENAYRLYPLRHLGWLASNQLVNFFACSHFRLRLEYEGNEREVGPNLDPGGLAQKNGFRPSLTTALRGGKMEA